MPGSRHLDSHTGTLPCGLYSPHHGATETGLAQDSARCQMNELAKAWHGSSPFIFEATGSWDVGAEVLVGPFFSFLASLHPIPAHKGVSWPPFQAHFTPRAWGVGGEGSGPGKKCILETHATQLLAPGTRS